MKERRPIKVDKEAYELLLREKELIGAKSISEVIVKSLREKKDPEREEVLRALRKAEELITKGRATNP